MFKLKCLQRRRHWGSPPRRVRAIGGGLEEYVQACASCHGIAGQGNGPLAEFMTVTVPDLTRISQENDGVFPMLQVIQIIDGRTGVRGHGSAMPVWGSRYQDGDLPGNGRIRCRAPGPGPHPGPRDTPGIDPGVTPRPRPVIRSGAHHDPSVGMIGRLAGGRDIGRGHVLQRHLQRLHIHRNGAVAGKDQGDPPRAVL
jgi:hypothetical protein